MSFIMCLFLWGHWIQSESMMLDLAVFIFLITCNCYYSIISFTKKLLCDLHRKMFCHSDVSFVSNSEKYSTNETKKTSFRGQVLEQDVYGMSRKWPAFNRTLANLPQKGHTCISILYKMFHVLYSLNVCPWLKVKDWFQGNICYRKITVFSLI